MAARSEKKAERNRTIYEAVEHGRRSIRKTAQEHGISATRVMQIVARERKLAEAGDYRMSDTFTGKVSMEPNGALVVNR